MSDAQAQTPPEEEASPEIQALMDERARLTLESEIRTLELTIATSEANLAVQQNNLATNQQNSITNLLPDTNTEGQNGTITIGENGGYYSQVLATMSINEAAKKIASKIAEKYPVDHDEKSTKTIVLFSGLDVAALAGRYHAVEIQLRSVEPTLNQLISMTNDSSKYVKESIGQTTESIVAAATALEAAPQILGAVADISKFFKSDTTITGRAVTGEASTLRVATAEALLSKDFINVIDPRYSLSLDTGLGDKYKAVRNKISVLSNNTLSISTEYDTKISEARDRVTENEMELVRLQAISEPDRTVQQKADLQSLPTTIELLRANLSRVTTTKTERIASLNNNIAAANTLVTAIVTNNENGTSPLAELRVYDLLQEASTKSNTILLNIEMVSIGGEYMIRKGAFVSDRVSYLGSATVRYEIIDGNGKYLLAGIATESLQASTKYKNGYTDLKAKVPQ